MDSQLRKDFFVLLDGHCEMLDELDNPFPAGLILITPAGVSTCGIEIYLVFSLMWAFYDQTFACLVDSANEMREKRSLALKALIHKEDWGTGLALETKTDVPHRDAFVKILNEPCDALGDINIPFPPGLILITPAGVSTWGMEISLIFSLFKAFYHSSFAQLIKIAQEELDEMPQSLKNELEELSKNQNGL